MLTEISAVPAGMRYRPKAAALSRVAMQDVILGGD